MTTGSDRPRQAGTAASVPSPGSDDTHECPRNGCTRRVPAHMLACRPHWRLIPAPLRSAVWGAWRNGAGAGTPAHDAAIRAAIRALNGQSDG